MNVGGVCVPSLEPLTAWEDRLPENGLQGRGQNRTREIRLSGIVGGLAESCAMGAGLRTTSKGAERPPDPTASCAALRSRQLHAGFVERGVETEHGEAIEAAAAERAGNR